jgi:hypothetical protein
MRRPAECASVLVDRNMGEVDAVCCSSRPVRRRSVEEGRNELDVRLAVEDSFLAHIARQATEDALAQNHRVEDGDLWRCRSASGPDVADLDLH